jgi:hypothetical protein
VVFASTHPERYPPNWHLTGIALSAGDGEPSRAVATYIGSCAYPSPLRETRFEL